MVTLVDYGLGNIQAFHNIYTRLKLPVDIASTPEQLRRAGKIILPGVGAFDWAMTRLNRSGLRDVLDELVMARHVPVLGVCVGMQMMAKGSEEGALPGLGWIKADVKRFRWNGEAGKGQMHLPHMGWNDVVPVETKSLFRNIDAPRYYFLHSYYIAADNPSEVLSTTDYGGSFTSAVRADNVFGVQFHPEKSHHWGVQLLKNFAEI